MAMPSRNIGVQLVIRDCFAEATGVPGKLSFDRIRRDAAAARHAFEAIGKRSGFQFVMLPAEATVSGGACMNLADAAKHIGMIKGRDVVASIAYYLNFGDLTAFTDAGHATKGLPLLMFGLPDNLKDLIGGRIDTGNGPFLASSYAQDAGFNFVVGTPKVCRPGTAAFTQNVETFLSAVQVYHSQRNLRIGMLGSDTRDFHYLSVQDRSGLPGANITPVNENLGRFVENAFALKDNNPLVIEAIKTLKKQSNCKAASPEKLLRMAKLLAQMNTWVKAEGLDATAVDCWTYLQQTARVCACSAMSALSQSGKSSACELDLYGTLSMLSASAAAQRAVGLADIFNCIFSPDDAREYLSSKKLGPALKALARETGMTVKEVLSSVSLPFHCGVWAADLTGKGTIITQRIMEKFLPKGDSIGCREALLREGSILTTRIAPNAQHGLTAYIFTSQSVEPLARSFGNYGFLVTPDQEAVMHAIHGDVMQTQRGKFPHHGAMVYCGPNVEDGNRVAEALKMGYRLSGYEVMDLRK